MKCFVTGANGFIGTALVRRLVEQGHEVTALLGPDMDDGGLEALEVERRALDVCDADSVDQALDGGEVLFHLAACYSFWLKDRRHIYDVNFGGTQRVLDAAIRHGYQRVVHTSSTATLTPALPESAEGYEEDRVVDLSRFQGHYKTSKLKAELAALRAAAKGLPVTIVHPTVPVGAGDRRPTPTGEMIVHFLEGRMKAYVPLELNLVDVEDVAEGHILALTEGAPGERYVLGGENMTMRAMLDILSEITGLNAPRVAIPISVLRTAGRVSEWISDHLTARPPLIPVEAALHAGCEMRFSSNKAREALGYSPRPARQALERAVSWFQGAGKGPGSASA